MRFHVPLLILALLAGSAGAAEVSDSALALCAGKAGDAERLACYDKMAEQRGLTIGEPSPLQEEAPGQWQEPAPGAEEPELTLTAQVGSSHGEQLPTLRIRCAGGMLEFMMDWHAYLGGRNQVLTRLGEQDAEALEWKRDPGDQTSVLMQQPKDFVRNMLATNRLYVQAVPFGEDPISAIFDLRGMQAGFAPMAEQCGMD